MWAQMVREGIVQCEEGMLEVSPSRQAPIPSLLKDETLRALLCRGGPPVGKNGQLVAMPEQQPPGWDMPRFLGDGQDSSGLAPDPDAPVHPMTELNQRLHGAPSGEEASEWTHDPALPKPQPPTTVRKTRHGSTQILEWKDEAQRIRLERGMRYGRWDTP